jgi:hypothetical protein
MMPTRDQWRLLCCTHRYVTGHSCRCDMPLQQPLGCFAPLLAAEQSMLLALALLMRCVVVAHAPGDGMEPCRKGGLVCRSACKVLGSMSGGWLHPATWQRAGWPTPMAGTIYGWGQKGCMVHTPDAVRCITRRWPCCSCSCRMQGMPGSFIARGTEPMLAPDAVPAYCSVVLGALLCSCIGEPRVHVPGAGTRAGTLQPGGLLRGSEVCSAAAE